MTYRNGLIAVIMKDGRPMRETNGTIVLPFGSEYEILLKNKTDVRARADIFIDGAPANTASYIIDANSKVIIKRFNLDGNDNSGRAFKFVEKAEAAKEIYTSGKDFGVVEVQFRKEMQPYVSYVPPAGITYRHPTYFGSDVVYKSEVTLGNSFTDDTPITCSAAPDQLSSGGTVQGSKVDQSFTSVYWNGDAWGTKTVIRIQLKGPVKQKIMSASHCHECGGIVKPAWKYCVSCGEKLIK